LCINSNEWRKNSNYLPIKVGIGINTGSLILGTVGGQKRMDGTVMSDSVNLTARTESLTKDYKVSLLITHHTFNALKNPDNYAIRMIDLVNVKGKNEIITIYEVFDADSKKIKAAKFATLDLFNRALTRYNEQNFDQAELLFKLCLENNPQDSVSQLYLSRIISQ
jgi:class 3 adenylate cyclase